MTSTVIQEIKGATKHRGQSPFGKGSGEIPKGIGGYFEILAMNRN